MNDLFINLNEYSTKKQRIYRLLLMGSLICIFLIIVSFSIIWLFSRSTEYLFGAISVYLILNLYFAWLSFKAKLFIKANENSIIFKFGIRSSSRDMFLWDTIKKVRIGPTYILLTKKSGKRRRFMLGWLPYIKVIEIKDQLTTLLDSIGVDYEVVDFIRYQNNTES